MPPCGEFRRPLGWLWRRPVAQAVFVGSGEVRRRKLRRFAEQSEIGVMPAARWNVAFELRFSVVLGWEQFPSVALLALHGGANRNTMSADDGSRAIRLDLSQFVTAVVIRLAGRPHAGIMAVIVGFE